MRRTTRCMTGNIGHTCISCTTLLVCAVAAVALMPACIAARAEPLTSHPEPRHLAAAEPLSLWHAWKQQAGATQQAHSARTLHEVVDDADAPGAGNSASLQKRGFKLNFYGALDDTRTAQETDYIMKTVMPTTAAVLSRSVRVRDPTGPLEVAGLEDGEGETIPGDESGIDADMLVKVFSLPDGSDICTGTAGLFTGFRYNEPTTGRPVFAQLQFCQFGNFDLESDVGVATHEIIHALGMDPSLFDSFLGYDNGKSDILTTIDGASYITTPNVIKSVEEHFQCSDVPGAEVEDDGGDGTAGGHWEERIFAGELMDGAQGLKFKHYERHALSDISLGLLQDTGWYDVKYGSAGFNTFGYGAGCKFAEGSFKEALAHSPAAQYLCEEQDVEGCTHDLSVHGTCIGFESWDGFNRIEPLSDSVDCQKGHDERGMRCLQGTQQDDSKQCIAMECSEQGEVLVGSDGSACDPDEMTCPDDVYMCEDPGVLMCVGELNDCSGVGDCYKGACYCHLGWGGADCSVPACVASDGCDDGSDCPASGFCGVPECGSWSSGAGDRGAPCTGAVGTITQEVGSAVSGGELSGGELSRLQAASDQSALPPRPPPHWRWGRHH